MRPAGNRPRCRPPGRASHWSGRMLQPWRRLERDRETSGGSLDIWRGTVDDLRLLRDRVEATGATWMIALAAGPSDRLDRSTRRSARDVRGSEAREAGGARRVLEARDAIDPTAREAMAIQVADRFLALPKSQAARTVMAFSSFGSNCRWRR